MGEECRLAPGVRRQEGGIGILRAPMAPIPTGIDLGIQLESLERDLGA